MIRGAPARTCGAARSGRRRKARRRSSATGAWSWPSAWWRARRCRSSSSTGPSGAPGSTSISGRIGSRRREHDLRADAVARAARPPDTRDPRDPVAPGRERPGRMAPRAAMGGSPTGKYFMDMSAGWKKDFPNLRHYYVFQIWPNSCSMGNGHGDMLREVQRTLPRLYSNMDIMSTLGIRPAGPCHYPLTGWAEFARLMEPLIERDFYDAVPRVPSRRPTSERASYTSRAKDAIALEFDQPIVWNGFARRSVLPGRSPATGRLGRGFRQGGHARIEGGIGGEDDHRRGNELESGQAARGRQRHRRAHVLRSADRRRKGHRRLIRGTP